MEIIQWILIGLNLYLVVGLMVYLADKEAKIKRKNYED